MFLEASNKNQLELEVWLELEVGKLQSASKLPVNITDYRGAYFRVV